MIRFSTKTDRIMLFIVLNINKFLLPVFHVQELKTSLAHIQKCSLVQNGICECPLFYQEGPSHF